MKRFRILSFVVVIAMLATSVVLAGPTHAQAKTLRITYVINGVLGDKSFFDSGERGINQIADKYGAKVKTIELGVDPAPWESGLKDAMADTANYDILITGTFQMNGYLGANVDKYPDKVFIIFDAPVAYDDPKVCTAGCKNVYSISYKQNEGSFLAGVYAAAMHTSKLDGLGTDVIIGAIGGDDIPVINDFVVGYQQGACMVSAKSQFLVQYTGGNWNDPAKGKEIALAMYQQKADIVFQIAGGTGVGVFEAANEQKKYAIGVDSDQATIIKETNPDEAARILTSMQKNVDNSLVRAIGLYNDNKLPLGKAEGLGLKEGGVSLSINDIYKKATPQNIQDLVAAVTDSVSKGDIKINSAFGDNITKVGKDCTGMPDMKFDISKYLK